MWVSFSLAFEKYISGLTLGMGLALHRAVDNLLPGLDLKLKWPNDMITQENKKVAGILCESIIMGDKDPLFVIGTGLNITNRIDSSISGKACSLKEICSFKKIHTSFFAKQNLPLLFLKEYLKETDIICKSLSKIGFKSIKKEYNSISAVKNRKIFILNPDKKCIIGNGIAKDVTDTGEIKVYLENGKTALFCSGEVTFQKDFNMVK
jgi:BirA family biotin operon repressor/biotin-[acetyl-CoA-carboxylase] ligase